MNLPFSDRHLGVKLLGRGSSEKTSLSGKPKATSE